MKSRSGQFLALPAILAIGWLIGDPVAAQTIETPKVERLTSDGHFKQHPAWSPDGRQLLFTMHSKGQVGLAVAAGGGWKSLRFDNDGPNFEPAWSPDGTRLVYVHDVLQGTDGQLQIHVMKANGSEPACFIEPAKRPAQDEHPAWSPDGKTIAFTTTRDGNQEIYLASVADRKLRRLTTDPGSDSHPSWSPDGKRLAFCSSRFGNVEICVMHADGADVRRLSHHAALDYAPKWSPDGNLIAFTSTRDGNYEIYVIRPDGAGLRNVSGHPSLDKDVAWQPNGQLTFLSNRAGRFDFYSLKP